MADMIDAKDAKNILGCDDAALNKHVNSGAIRAQRTGGKLMLNREDVEKLAKDDDGTIVLTGDSDDLSIDLGKVVDDSADTIIQNRPTDSAAGTESITFGEELEVVSMDEQSTGELVFDETKQTGGVQNLSFTDSNTAVMTAVDETSVGATTAPVDFQTSESRSVNDQRSPSGRRSVRSQRVMEAPAPVHWIWPTLLATTFLIGLFFVVPYYFISLHPTGEKYENGDAKRGTDDNAWTSMAGKIAGFTVEPDEAKAKKNGEAEYMDIKTRDPQAVWRHKLFVGTHDKEPGEAVGRFVITDVGLDGKTAKSKFGDEYQVTEVQPMVGPTPTEGDPAPVADGTAPAKQYNVEVYAK